MTKILVVPVRSMNGAVGGSGGTTDRLGAHGVMLGVRVDVMNKTASEHDVHLEHDKRQYRQASTPSRNAASIHHLDFRTTIASAIYFLTTDGHR